MVYPDFISFFLDLVRACGERLIYTDYTVAFLSVGFTFGIIALSRALIFGGKIK